MDGLEEELRKMERLDPQGLKVFLTGEIMDLEKFIGKEPTTERFDELMEQSIKMLYDRYNKAFHASKMYFHYLIQNRRRGYNPA